MSRRISPAILGWLAGYLVVMGLAAWGLESARRAVIRKFDDPATLAAWRAWADETRRPASDDQPVARRPVKSDEPPSLVLMRDHFRVIQIVTLSISSFLFAFLAFVAHGLWQQKGGAGSPEQPQKTPYTK